MKSRTTLRFVSLLSTCLILVAAGVALTPNAQGAIGVCDTSSNVDVEASGGTAQFGYTTLGAAFAAINAGTHTGAIAIMMAPKVRPPMRSMA